MKGFFLARILAWTGAKLDGKKTVIGGVGLIVTGVLGLLSHAFPDQPFPAMEIETALGSISAGLVSLGLGGKAEKLTAEVREAAGKGPGCDGGKQNF